MNLFNNKILCCIFAASCLSTVSAQEKKLSDYVSTPKFGGYIIGKYTYQDNEGTTNNGDGFNARLIRVYVDGTILKDFKYRIQAEINNTPHVKDFTLEWAKYKEFSVKVGQFKRAFTFENPYNPFDVGLGDYSQLVKKLAGMGDRCGEASTGGRDQGIQVQGDLFPSKKDGHRFVHYQLAVYNGNGINKADNNKQKDLIGTIQFQPINKLYLGVFGWKGTWGAEGSQVDRKRYSLGLKYESDWTVRAEYGHAEGAGTAVKGVSYNKADSWYATVGAPVSKHLKVYAKYDQYREGCINDNLSVMYSLVANYKFHKNFVLQLQYNRIHNKTAADPDYNQIWAETYVRF